MYLYYIYTVDGWAWFTCSSDKRYFRFGCQLLCRAPKKDYWYLNKDNSQGKVVPMDSFSRQNTSANLDT